MLGRASLGEGILLKGGQFGGLEVGKNQYMAATLAAKKTPSKAANVSIGEF